MKINLLLLPFCLFILGGLQFCAAQNNSNTRSSINKNVSTGSKLIKLFGGGFSTEGPAYAPDGSIYFSDQTFTSETNMTAGIIWRYIPWKDTMVVFMSPSGMSGGIVFDKNGNMLIAEGADYGLRCILSKNMKTGISKIVAGLYNGKPFNSPNDLVIDRENRIYFTDPRYVGHEKVEQPVNGVYRIDTSGNVELLINDISMPNGIALSPDQKKLFVGCYDEDEKYDPNSKIKKGMFIASYNILSDGSVAFNKILVRFKDGSGPDGIKVDKNGNLFVAVRNDKTPAIKVYSSKGKEELSILLPEVPSNLAFGKGKDKHELYITAGKSLYKIFITYRSFHSGDQ